MTDATVLLPDGSQVPLASGSTMQLKVTATAFAAKDSMVTLANDTSATLDEKAMVNLAGGTELAVDESAVPAGSVSRTGELPAGSSVSLPSKLTVTLPSHATGPYAGIIANAKRGSTVKLSGGTVVTLKNDSRVYLDPNNPVMLSAEEGPKPSQRSLNLVRFITIIYGVGIAIVLGVNKPWSLSPTQSWQLSVVVLGVAIFMIYGGFSYIMSVSDGPFVYHFDDNGEGARVLSLARVASDIVLAALYVRALLIATERTHPSSQDILYAMAWVFGWIIVIRFVRYGFKKPEIWRNLPSGCTFVLFGVTLYAAASWDGWFTGKINGALVAIVTALVISSIAATEILSVIARRMSPSVTIGAEQLIRKIRE